MTFDPAKDCDREDCRIQESGGSTTCMYFPPIYDKYGNNINPDGNITTYHMKCSTCGTSWIDSYQYGKKLS